MVLDWIGPPEDAMVPIPIAESSQEEGRRTRKREEDGIKWKVAWADRIGSDLAASMTGSCDSNRTA